MLTSKQDVADIFDVLLVLYPHTWKDQVSLTRAKRVWYQTLVDSKLDAELIPKGLADVRKSENDFVLPVGKFIAMCKRHRRDPVQFELKSKLSAEQNRKLGLKTLGELTRMLSE